MIEGCVSLERTAQGKHASGPCPREPLALLKRDDVEQNGKSRRQPSAPPQTPTARSWASRVSHAVAVLRRSGWSDSSTHLSHRPLASTGRTGSVLTGACRCDLPTRARGCFSDLRGGHATATSGGRSESLQFVEETTGVSRKERIVLDMVNGLVSTMPSCVYRLSRRGQSAPPVYMPYARLPLSLLREPRGHGS